LVSLGSDLVDFIDVHDYDGRESCGHQLLLPGLANSEFPAKSTEGMEKGWIDSV
jgi:hypothetical protein